MQFRPCIDIHNGKVKQIVGGSLRDRGDRAQENFVASQDAAYFARLYRKEGLKGGHVILLNPSASEYYEESRKQALSALAAYPGGLQIGGGICPQNGAFFLDAGASHVIVTSYVFREGRICYDRLAEMCRAVGREHLVLDLSCRRAGAEYRVVTDRWQNLTRETVNARLLEDLSKYCDEFLIHGVDAEGKAEGMEEDLVRLLGSWCGRPLTYAGGVRSLEDLRLLRELGKGHVDVTIGSALDLFGGKLGFDQVLEFCKSASENRV